MELFFCGVIFIMVVFPLIDAIISLFQQAINYLQVCIAVKAAKKQAEVDELQGTNDGMQFDTQAIGFEIPSETEEYIDERRNP